MIQQQVVSNIVVGPTSTATNTTNGMFYDNSTVGSYPKSIVGTHESPPPQQQLTTSSSSSSAQAPHLLVGSASEVMSSSGAIVASNAACYMMQNIEESKKINKKETGTYSDMITSGGVKRKQTDLTDDQDNDSENDVDRANQDDLHDYEKVRKSWIVYFILKKFINISHYI